MKDKLPKILFLFFMPVVNGLPFVLPFLWDALFFLVFISFVLFFKITNGLKSVKEQIWYSLILVVTWNIVSLSWLFFNNALLWGSCMAVALAALIMFIPFPIYFCGINRLPIKNGYKYFLFIFVWFFVEWLCFRWELAFPFHALGNCLGNIPLLIRWYQYTGVLGGTVWVLFANGTIIELLNKHSAKINKWGYLILALVPPIASVGMSFSPPKIGCFEKILVVNVLQNDDSRNDQLFQAVLGQLSTNLDTSVFLAVCPESICYLPASSFPYNSYFTSIKRMLKQKAPQATVVFGASTQDIEVGASFNKKGLFNMAISCDTSGLVGFRNKMRLVPFGEFIPYHGLFGKMPGIDAILADPLVCKETYDSVFCINKVWILSLICYELYFGNAIAHYVREKNILLLVSISNDYALHKPIFANHLIRMARIQAISFHKSVVKSTAHGFSLIISPTGVILAKSGFNTAEVISAQVPINGELTLYGKYGDNMAFLFLFLLFFIIFMLSYL